MANAKETYISNDEERLIIKIADVIGIIYDEFNQSEYHENTYEGSDGITLNKVYEFKDNSPKHILNKIIDLDENNQYWLFIDAIEDVEYNYCEYYK